MAVTVGTLTFSQGWIYDLKQWTYKAARNETLPDSSRGQQFGPDPKTMKPLGSRFHHLNAKTAAAIVILWAGLAGIADTGAFSDFGVALAWAIALGVVLYWGRDAAAGIQELI